MTIFIVSIFCTTYTWQDLANATLKNNLDLSISQNKINMSRLDSKISYAPFLPTVDSSYQKDKYQERLNVGVNQNLFNGFRDVLNTKMAIAAQELSILSDTLTKIDIGYQLRVIYFRSLYLQELVNLSKSIIARRKENLELVALRFDSGRENKGSLLLSEANLKQAEYELLQAENSLTIEQKNIQIMTGLENATLQGDLNTKLSKNAINFEKALEIHPQILMANLEIDRSKNAIAGNAASYLPSLNLGISISDLNTGNHSREIGFSLNWNLFDGGKDYYTTYKSIINKNNTITNRLKIKQELTAKIQETFIKTQESAKNVEVTTSFMEALTIRAEIARSKYNNGLISFEEWDQVESDLIYREQSELTAKLNFSINEATFNKELGINIL